MWRCGALRRKSDLRRNLSRIPGFKAHSTSLTFLYEDGVFI
jgi:hypothetical protein